MIYVTFSTSNVKRIFLEPTSIHGDLHRIAGLSNFSLPDRVREVNPKKLVLNGAGWKNDDLKLSKMFPGSGSLCYFLEGCLKHGKYINHKV